MNYPLDSRMPRPHRRKTSFALAVLLAGVLVGSSVLAQAGAQATTPVPANSAQSRAPQTNATKQGSAPTKPRAVPLKPAAATNPYLPNRFAGKAGRYYKLVWGIEAPSVKWAESGEMIRFSWRVVDPERAGVLNDKKIEPSLIDPKAGVSLVVPVMDKIGQLRQSAPPEAGKSYWMAFSNKGRLVKRGDRVDVVIGPFRAENLAVD
jgi:hypothetical protein